MKLKDFYNDGFGWACKHCEAELHGTENSNGPSRIMREGESESKNPELSTKALAKWVDMARTALTCPRCGITERVEN